MTGRATRSIGIILSFRPSFGQKNLEEFFTKEEKSNEPKSASRDSRTSTYKLDADGADYVFSLASLDPEKILVERSTADTDPPKYDLMINAKDEKKEIKRTASVRYDRSVPHNYADMTSRLTLSFDSQETARRFEKAFKHAAKLSQGASKEPF